MLKIVKNNYLSEDEKYVRNKIFVEEQEFHNEFDEIDPTCTHILLYEDDTIIGCCRFYNENNVAHFGRLAIVKEYRNHNYGELLLSEAEKEAYEQGFHEMILGAQCRVQNFYEKSGYYAYGDIYYDEYCPHIMMKKTLYEPRKIRVGTMDDLDAILHLFEISVEAMIASGNTTQWKKGYPSKETLINDIKNQNLYILENKNEILASFTFIIGHDATYDIIEEGNWKYDETYGTLHRLASNQKERYIFNDVFHFIKHKMNYIRIDTHKNNKAMLKSVKKYGFTYSGIIYASDHTKRVAFEYKHKPL